MPKGFVLFSALLFLLIFSLLSLYSLSAVTLSTKANRDAYQAMQVKLQADHALTLAETEFRYGISYCLIEVTSLAKLAKLSQTEWQQRGCTGHLQAINYYYVVESLGIDPCGVVHKNNNLFAADYYRITLLAESADLIYKTLLQSTLVLASHQKPACQQVERQVKIGRQSWRQWTTGI